MLSTAGWFDLTGQPFRSGEETQPSFRSSYAFVTLGPRTATTAIGRGGRHALDNLAVCCRRYNGIKGQLTEGETPLLGVEVVEPSYNGIKGQLTEGKFRELLALLSGWHPAARADLERRLLAGGRRYAGARRRFPALLLRAGLLPCWRVVRRGRR